MHPHSDLITPRAAAFAKELEFFARTRIEGFLKGHNRSVMRGTSTEFLQHRQYFPGDDLRSLDWRVFARSDRLVARVYEEYTNLDLILCLDGTGSMGYASGSMSKLAFAQRCAAMLAYVLNLQHDRCGAAVLTRRVADQIEPSTGRKHLARLLRHIAALEPAGETDMAACMAQLGARLRRRSVVVVFSDCYQDPEELTRAIGLLTLAGHDAIIYQVCDPGEQELQFAGFTLFRDLENGQIDPADPLEIRDAYRQVFLEHTQRLRNGAAAYAIEFHHLIVQPDWDQTMAKLLHQRAHRA